MAQPVATWNNALYGAPMLPRNGYRVRQDSLQRRVEPLDGPARFRRVLEDGLVVVDVVIMQDAAQFDAFEAFVAGTLRGGRDWFEIDLYVGTAPRTLVAHLVDQYQVRVVGQGLAHAQVTMTLECFERASTVYEHADSVWIVAGTAASPSSPDNIIDPGSAGDPAPSSAVIWGGGEIGLEPPV